MPTNITDREKDHSNELIGRDDILTELDHYKDIAASGESMCVFLKGETGVGKTRVAEEFLEGCDDDGFEVLRGRCLYYESTDPYLTFYEALDEYLEGEEKETEVQELGPGFIGQPIEADSTDTTTMSFIMGEQEDQEIDEETSFTDRQDLMFTRITELFKDISEEHPVVFFIDDLQWIDDSSAQLLHHLARNLTEDKVMILGAYRPEELLHEEERLPLEDTLSRMKEERIVEIVEIPRLDQPSVSEMVKNHLQRQDLPEEFIWTLYRESEGNPFYVKEILDSMMKEGVIDPHSFTWDPHEELSNITIPSSIKDITTRKIDDLDRDEKKVLMFASLIGTEFDFRILEEVMDIDVIELLDIIDSLKEQGIIDEVEDVDEEIYRFHHMQTRTILYEEMSRSRKRVSHRRIGEILEDFYEDELEEHYFELSQHFYEAREYEKAYRYSKKAGEKALQSLDIYRGRDYFEKALESLRRAKGIEDSSEKEIELMKMLGSIYSDIPEWDTAREIYEEVLKNARNIDDKYEEGRGLMRLGHVYKYMGEYDKAEEYLNEGLDICEELDDLSGIAQCNRGLGYVKWREGLFKKAERHYQEAIEKAKKADDDKELALNYLNLANVYAQRGEHEKGIQFYQKSLPPLEARNIYRELARAHNNLGDQYMKKEEWDKAIEYFDRCIEYAEKIDNKSYYGWGSFNAAEAYSKKGETEKGWEYIEGIEELMDEIDDHIGLAAVHHKKGLLHEVDGELDEAIERYKKALETMEPYDVPFNTAEYRLDLGLAYRDKGEVEKARELIEKAYKTITELGATEKFEKKARDALDSLPD